MPTLLERYRQRLQHEHGWEVELACPDCRHDGRPDYDGWTPTSAMRFGDRPTIYANVSCHNCGRDLKHEAGEKLVEVFSEVRTDRRNRRLLLILSGWAVGLPLLLMACVWQGTRLGWWDNSAYACIVCFTLFVPVATMWFNWQVHGIRHRCECGQPAYLFMGMLGRSYCYRCSSCGRLLRLRD